jgi:hypothetical protein
VNGKGESVISKSNHSSTWFYVQLEYLHRRGFVLIRVFRGSLFGRVANAIHELHEIARTGKL